MRGHDPILTLRRQGRKHSFVSFNVGLQSDWLADHWHETEGMVPHILVEPGDPIERLDLRFVVGLVVDVSGHVEHADRVRRVHSACIAAGASRVIGAIHQRRGECLQAVEYLDSAEVLTWPE